LDTSFLAPFYIQEATSESVEGILLTLPSQALAISNWTIVEFASLLARRVRMGELGSELMQAIMQAFRDDVSQSYHVFEVTAADFNLATELILQWKSGLRAGDALHLAIAQNSQVDNFLSLDRGLIDAAQQLRIPANSSGLL
jgi:predicted nucleic acid-binding protein